MKLWKQMFIYLICLFIPLLNILGFVMIENINKERMNSEIEYLISKHKSLENTIVLNNKAVNDDMFGKNLSPYIEISPYYFDNLSAGEFFQILDKDNKIIFSNFEKDKSTDSREDIKEAKLEERSFLIKKVNNERFLFVTSKIKLRNDTYTLSLVKSIEDIYHERQNNYRLFISIELILSLFVIIGVLVISKRLTKTVSKLSFASRRVTEGDLSVRVHNGEENSEVGELAKNFNIMIESLEKKIHELRELNESKESFINNLTHEMKTPLTSIIGYSDLLMRGSLSEDTKNMALGHINLQGKRLEKLNSTLISLILMDKHGLAFEKINLNDLALKAKHSLSLELENKQIDLRIKVDHLYISGNRELLEILVNNLLSNAIKASNVCEAIDVISKNENNIISLSIRDYGVGIPAEELNKIREPFYMVDKSRDRKSNGLGLGLALCDEICRLHDIKMDFTSEIGQGTTVTLIFTEEESI